jgi:glutamine amidotransferase PdxT
LQALEVDYTDESEVLTPADEANHIDKWAFKVPFVCGATNLGEALRRIGEGAAMIRSKGEAGTGDIVEAVRHLRQIRSEMRRNAFGRQLRSFEADVEIEGVSGPPIHAIFIRAPWVQETGPEVRVLAEVDGHPVAVRRDNVMAISFHPELTGEHRLHELLLGLVAPRPAVDRDGVNDVASG